jgi:hypothetical protein
MDAPKPLAVQALVRCEDERKILLSGLRQTVLWIERAAGAAPKIALTAAPTLQTSGSAKPIDIALVFFIADAAANEADFEPVARSWRRQILDFTAATDTPLFLCTVFRHVGPAAENCHRGAVARLERIRRINMLIVELSQSAGAYVMDIDSVMAHVGGARLQSDFSMRGRMAAAAAGEVIASALLNEGLDAHMPAEVLARAVALHGGRRGILHRLNKAIASGDTRGAA